MSSSYSSKGREGESRVILKFDRAVTEKEVEEIQAEHNAISATLETSDGQHDFEVEENDVDETEPE
ncbi:hypothetical protein [Streptomyces sp. NBC_00162]|uniref:hypothetical protein n=1 Tax=Streptomyces sp. NBC_00162 TaxID=2903629 RepID=UPI00214CDDAE|nr:hypothetical protein [Streptomyces sp. NBC_00162]UUU43980.1 hypothetical protein JIW86_37340 [Streptomyces sp. NBC_00162]